MTDIASDLKERFDFAALWFLARYEVLPDGKNVTDLSDEDAKAVEILETLLNSVDAIPPSLIKATEELRVVRGVLEGNEPAAAGPGNGIVEQPFPTLRRFHQGAAARDGFQSGGMRSPRSKRRYFSAVHAC